MKEQAFYKTINSLVENLRERAFGTEILYGMCSDKLHAWGHEARLADKLWFISRLYRNNFRDCYLRYDEKEVDGKKFCRHRRVNVFGAIAYQLFQNEKYKPFTEKISHTDWEFAYDAGKNDLAHFKESLSAVLEFNDILNDAIQSFDALYCQEPSSHNNIRFVSKFLHFHRPGQFFMHDFDFRKGRIHFRSQNGCRILDMIIDDEAKRTIEETFRNVLKFLYDDGVLQDDNNILFPKGDYIRSMSLQYAICCYIKEYSDKIDGLQFLPMPLVSAEILASVRKLKTREELDKILAEIDSKAPLTQVALYFEDTVEFDQALLQNSVKNEDN